MKAFCLLNHQLTENQVQELKDDYNCSEIVYPSEAVSAAWCQIPAEKELDYKTVSKVIEWLSSAESGDVFIIQGEFGSTFLLVDYALKSNLIPVHAVTKRVAKEQRNGEIVNRQYVFEHVCFRKYCYYSK